MDTREIHSVCRRLIMPALLSLASPLAMAQEAALEPDIMISTGIEGGGYWSAGQRLQSVAKEMRVSVINLTSTGSIDNLERLADADNPVNMAFAQADATEHYLLDNPAARQTLDIVENIGQECVFIMTGSKSGLQTDGDLAEGKNLRLGIDSATSGVAVTLQYMRRLVPELASVEVVYGDTSAAIGQLNDPASELDAVMVVHRPKEHSAAVDAARNNPDGFRFLEVSDKRFTIEASKGHKIYRKMKLAVPGLKEPVTTICVRGLLLLEKSKVDADVRGKLAKLVDYHWMRVYATP